MRLAALLLFAPSCATPGGHYIAVAPDPIECARASLRAAAVQAPCDRSPPPPTAEIVACVFGAAAELLPCMPGRQWVADAAMDGGRL